MKHEVLIGQTDYTVLVKIRDTAGAPATGLDEGDIDIAYARVETDNDVTTADVTPAALASLTAAHTDWGFEEVSATDHPGVYRLDIADAVFASGAWSAVVTVTGTGLDPADCEFILVEHNPMTALTAVKAKTDNLPSDPADESSIQAAIADVEGKVDDLETRLGIPSDLGSGATVAANLVDIEGQTDNLPAIETKIDTIDDFLDTEVAAILTAVDTEVAAILVKVNLLPEAPAKNTALDYVIKMVDSSDHVTPKTGLTVTMTRFNGTAFEAAAGSVTEISTGHYKVAAAAADMNFDMVTHRFTATGADDLTVEFRTVA